MKFEWDPKKARSNFRKHRVSFEEAVLVFSDILSFTYDDEAHSQAERRYATLGMSARRRVLVVAHTMRGEQVRIISAREATPRERRWYEKENKQNRR
ncbi:MAG: BrnT family toxin [Pyrinomonadaceae bacterium]|nr:BrnT family toxin [Pyrinomonadaceae bacterium]